MSLLYEIINPDQVSRADLAVFIPSYEEAANISLPVAKVSLGLKKFFPDLASVIVNCDNNSGDGTREAFFAAESGTPRVYVSTPPGVRGKGANLQNIFQLAADFSARAVVMVDANLLSIKTTWIKSLAGPILSGQAEYTSPLYVRQKLDAPVGRGLVYPMMRMLFGRRVLQPICVDHAFSGRLNEIFRQREWALDDRGYKSDLGLLSTAIINQASICQSFMAHPRISTVASLDYDLPRSFSYVVRALFDLMIETWGFWRGVKRSRPTCMAGLDEPVPSPPPEAEGSRDYLLNGFIELGREFKPVWGQYFPPDLAAELAAGLTLAEGGGRPEMSIDLWRRVIFAAALAYKNAEPDGRLALSRALAPLFLARELVANLAFEGLTVGQTNSRVEEDALNFEMARAELTTAWAAGAA
ncbi:MAG: hypothetical protein LBP55_01170 [Candidatus Adiutrix sp.]|jgi:hypothetical protein|nr:hypothetical protein [Candidatus Adiutrix sp.]